MKPKELHPAALRDEAPFFISIFLVAKLTNGNSIAFIRDAA